ncbi:MAG: glucose-6-phosphate dehydrogenase assembly protein OpcA [Vulcanimicrobiota bacterium]
MSSRLNTTCLESFPLNELLQRFSEQWAEHRRGAEEPVTRIASFNLIVVSSNQPEPELDEILEGLRESHPARVIWIRLAPSLPWEEATAALELCTRNDCDQVCSEQIKITCGPQPERLSSLILPLIRSGLPTQLLWWNAGVPEGALFDRLSDRARLVLLADPDWKSLAPRLPGLWDDRYHREHTFVPLAWFEVLPVRQSIAAAYGQKDIVLEFGPDSDLHAGMSLLQSWIKTTIPGRDSLGGWKGEGLTMIEVERDPRSVLLKWDDSSQKLSSQSGLEALRAALNKPRRDRVFSRVVDHLRKLYP